MVILMVKVTSKRPIVANLGSKWPQNSLNWSIQGVYWVFHFKKDKKFDSGVQGVSPEKDRKTNSQINENTKKSNFWDHQIFRGYRNPLTGLYHIYVT